MWMTTWRTSIINPAVNTTLPTVNSSAPFLLNSPRPILVHTGWSGPAHATSSSALLAAAQFFKFKVYGVKISWNARITAVLGGGASASLNQDQLNRPYRFCINAGAENAGGVSSLPVSPYITPEMRWGRCTDIDAPGQPNKWHSVYYSIKKLMSNQYIDTIPETGGITDGLDTSGFAATNQPTVGPNLRIGIVPADAITSPSLYEPNFTVVMKWEFYTRYSDRTTSNLQ